MKLLSKFGFKLNLDLPALRSRNYRLYFAGQALSMTGNFMAQVAILWLIYRLTDSALLLGLAGFLGHLPVFVLAPVSGILADRYNRHRLLLLLQIVGISLSVTLTVITFLGWANFWTLLTLSAFLGVLKGLDVPVRQAFVSDMVSRELMGNAIALNAAFLNGARLIGPAIGGIFIAQFGAGFCFLYDSLSYLVAIGAISAMQITPRTVEIQTSTLQVAASNTVLQFIVEDGKRGRVMSFYAMCFMGMAPFGNLLAGTLAHYLKAPNTLILGGVVCIVGSVLFVQQLPQMAKLIHLGTEQVVNQ